MFHQMVLKQRKRWSVLVFAFVFVLVFAAVAVIVVAVIDNDGDVVFSSIFVLFNVLLVLNFNLRLGLKSIPARKLRWGPEVCKPGSGQQSDGFRVHLTIGGWPQVLSWRTLKLGLRSIPGGSCEDACVALIQ